jgi:hypothetical protein
VGIPIFLRVAVLLISPMPIAFVACAMTFDDILITSEVLYQKTLVGEF